MDAKVQIQIFKQEAIRWINDRMEDLIGDGIGGKLLRPIAEELVEKYAHSEGIDAFLSIFIDQEGRFNIDGLLDKYIEALTAGGGIKFRWGDIFPPAAMLDRLNGGKINVITAADIKALKDAFIARVGMNT